HHVQEAHDRRHDSTDHVQRPAAGDSRQLPARDLVFGRAPLHVGGGAMRRDAPDHARTARVGIGTSSSRAARPSTIITMGSCAGRTVYMKSCDTRTTSIALHQNVSELGPPRQVWMNADPMKARNMTAAGTPCDTAIIHSCP